MKSREENNLVMRSYSHRMRNAILSLLGNKCNQCGFEDIRALQIDHINGGGSKQRKSIGGRQLYKIVLDELLTGSAAYQLLCANCNWIKRDVNKEHRYK